MKKMRLESMEHFVGIIPDEQLVKICFIQIDTALDQCNEILKDKGMSIERPNILILKDKEYLRPIE